MYRIVSPWASAVPVLFIWQIVNDAQVAVNAAVGAVLFAGSLRLRLRVVEAALPQPSVVVSVIV